MKKDDYAGFGNRLAFLGFSKVKVGRRYKLPIHYLKQEDVSILESKGFGLKFKCVEKLPGYAVFENVFGNRMCFRYFDLATILREEKTA